jgi:hypothetical protein
MTISAEGNQERIVRIIQNIILYKIRADIINKIRGKEE